jgi:hypothetical protein
MPRPPFRSALRHPRLALVAGGAAVLLAGGGATAAVASTSAGSTPASPTASCAPGVGRLLHALPASLNADLKHLRKDSAANKAADRAEIKKKALAGDYGVRYERVARIASGVKGGAASALPAELKADLKTLRGETKGSSARADQAAEIWKKAAAGDYGTRIEGLAKSARSAAEQRCAAKASGSAGS